MAAVSGQRLANAAKETLTKIRTDPSFDHFYANVACKSEGLLGEPTLPTKRPTLARLKIFAGAPSYPQTAKDHFRKVYYEATHLIVRAIYQRVTDQESFCFYAQMETLLLKLLMVSAMRQRSVSWGIIQRRCWYEDSTWATKYFGSYVKGGENIMFWRNGVGGVKFPEPKKKLIQ